MTEDDAIAASESTRDALIRAAERLMAQHGIEGAELGAITRLAGQRNRSAIHYHFTDRNGLIVAIRDKHRPAIDAHRARMLERVVAEGDLGLHALARVLVEPMAAPLATASGRDFLIITAEAAGRTGSRALVASELPYTDALNQLTGLLIERVTGDPARRRALVSHAVLTASVLLADIARDLAAGRAPAADREQRVNTVIDFIVGALQAPPTTVDS